MQYHLTSRASHPPADFDLMAVRVLEGAIGTIIVLALGALAVWLVVRFNADRPDAAPPKKTEPSTRSERQGLFHRR